MTSTRKAPHCKTCHKPLKGHKRGVCDTTSTSTSAPPPGPTPPRIKSARKSAPLPLGPLPTLSPESSQILNNILRTNSRTEPPPIEVPFKRTLRSASAGRDAESLHVALERLSASEAKQSKTPSAREYTPTEGDERESLDLEPPAGTQASTLAVSQKLGPQPFSQASTSSVAASQQLGLRVQDVHGSVRTIQQQPSTASDAEVTIQNFLDSTAQSSHHPPATIFSFPANAVPSLEDGAQRLGLFVRVLPLPSTNEEWVPVVVGRDQDAVVKLLEDSEKLAQAVRKSGGFNVGEFRVGMSHIVAGTLGALATWAGLAYT